ncbi:c-type cytochrome [Cellvibrio fontiphilus]|uniref:C-type cytochrome n=1 Tax=Cellvibrio fontiphilus TaxID=1815559 RepID=A0ABV7FCJ4_9GAMM
MLVFLLIGVMCIVVDAAASTTTGEVVTPAALAIGNKAAQDERCAECHGLDGNVHHPNEAGKIPKLAGQRPDYLLKQFQDFRSGERHNDFMALMARNLDDADVEPIFAWYVNQTPMSGNGINKDKANENSTVSALGETLFLNGDSKRDIVACALCHGADARGVDAPVNGYAQLAPELIPVLAGQDWHYLDQQLRNWRSGERTNSPDSIMNRVTQQLTDEEISALNDYLSGLP